MPLSNKLWCLASATALPASRQARRAAAAVPAHRDDRPGRLPRLRQRCTAHAGRAKHLPLVIEWTAGSESLPTTDIPTTPDTPPARQQHLHASSWRPPRARGGDVRGIPAPGRPAPVGRGAVRRRRLAGRRAAEEARHAVRHGAVDQAGAQAREARRAPERARRHRALAQLAPHLLLALRHGRVGLRRAPCRGSCRGSRVQLTARAAVQRGARPARPPCRLPRLRGAAVGRTSMQTRLRVRSWFLAGSARAPTI